MQKGMQRKRVRQRRRGEPYGSMLTACPQIWSEQVTVGGNAEPLSHDPLGTICPSNAVGLSSLLPCASWLFCLTCRKSDPLATVCRQVGMDRTLLSSWVTVNGVSGNIWESAVMGRCWVNPQSLTLLQELGLSGGEGHEAMRQTREKLPVNEDRSEQLSQGLGQNLARRNASLATSEKVVGAQ